LAGLGAISIPICRHGGPNCSATESTVFCMHCSKTIRFNITANLKCFDLICSMTFHEMLSVATRNLNRFRFDTIRIHTFLSKVAQIAQQQPMPSFARSSWNVVSEFEKPLIFLLLCDFRPCSHVDFSGNNYPACSAQSEKSCQRCACLVMSEMQLTLGGRQTSQGQKSTKGFGFNCAVRICLGCNVDMFVTM
jgi:hypothetical protein